IANGFPRSELLFRGHRTRLDVTPGRKLLRLFSPPVYNVQTDEWSSPARSPALPRITPLLLLLFGLLLVPAARAEPHWSLRPRSSPKPPVSDREGRAWVRNGVDAFVLERLRAKGLRPAPEADRATLIRRLSFDLTGLPPTPKEIAAFVADTSPDAYEKLVDRLLASPHYGERWAQHWPDVVRYAESD